MRPSQDGTLPMEWACRGGNVEFVKELLSLSADVNHVVVRASE